MVSPLRNCAANAATPGGLAEKIAWGRKMFNQIKWLFFDIGSTLMDETAAYSHRLNDIAVQAKIPYETVYKTAVSFYKQNKKGDLESAKYFGAVLPKWYSEDERLYPDTAECLVRLSRKYKIGIIANQDFGAKERLDQHNILQYIDLVVASAEEGIAKPDKRIFEIALERSGCQPHNAVMIGDRIDNDILPANQMGMHTIWIKQGFGMYWNILSEAEKPDLTVHNLTELCDIL